MKTTWARRVCSHHALCGISHAHLARLVNELAAPWTARHEAALEQRRGRARQRATGAGPNHHLVFADRLLVTLVVLRFQLPHQVLAVMFGVDRSTVTRAVHEVRPLLAQRGFAVPDRPGIRLKTLADVFAYAAAEGVTLRIDGTEVQVSRPWSATATAGCCGQGRPVRAACTTPPPCAPKASKTCCAATRRSKPRSTPATRAWPATSPTRSARRRGNPPRTPRPSRWPPTSRPANSSRRGGSASNTRSLNPSSGGRCNATSAAANTSTRPSRPSPGWSPTAPPCADRREDHQTNAPGKHAPTSIAHQPVNASPNIGPINGSAPCAACLSFVTGPAGIVVRRDRLGGLIQEYARVA